MRVIAGSARGLRLVAPKDPRTRPIADRVKETLFAILGDRVADAQALDLYAGTGAIGIEALSRGAVHATFVERSREALLAIRENLARTDMGARASVHSGDVEAFLGSDFIGAFDLAFVDPPYAERAILAPLERLVPHLAPGATVVVKHFWRTPIPQVPGLAHCRERRFGETGLTFLEATGRADAAEES